MSEKSILHLDMDTFFVSVERLINPDLYGRPVIISGKSSRGVVASCSYEARKFGIKSGIPIKLAKKLCKDGIYISGSSKIYEEYSEAVTQIIAEESPVFEKTSIDEHFIDISGMDKFFGLKKWTQNLRNRIMRETGLPVSAGVSVNKTVAKIATTMAKPCGELFVPKNKISVFLDPLPVDIIPGVGEKSKQILHSLNIHKIKELRKCNPKILKQLLGYNGFILWKRANGIDPREVRPYEGHKSLSAEHTFDIDIYDRNKILDLLLKQTQNLTFILRKQHRMTACITLKIRYSDFSTFSKQQSIQPTNFDHDIIPVIKTLLKKLYTKRKKVRLAGIKLSCLTHGHTQLKIFENRKKMADLYREIDFLKEKYGKNIIKISGILKEYK